MLFGISGLWVCGPLTRSQIQANEVGTRARADKRKQTLTPPFIVMVARLQKEVGTKYFFRGTNFLEKCSDMFPPFFWAFVLWVRKIPAKFPPNFLPNFPPKNRKKKSPTSFCRSAARIYDIPADVQGVKFRSSPRNLGKKGAFWRGRP